MKTARIIVSGRVQGVFFRQEAKSVARNLKLAGRIRNVADGKVEALVQGEEENIQKFIAWCRRGPPLAKVEGVKVTWENIEQEYDSFEIQ